MEIKKFFALGATVVVSAEGGWQSDALGVVVSDPEAVQTLQGEDCFYWIQFFEPQPDLSDDGPYLRARLRDGSFPS